MNQDDDHRNLPIGQHIHDILGLALQQADVESRRTIDPIELAKRLEIPVVVTAGKSNCKESRAEEIYIDPCCASDPAALRDAIRHGLAHILARRARLGVEDLKRHMQHPVAVAAAEHIASEIASYLAVTNEQLFIWMEEHPHHTNIDAAVEFGVPLDRMTCRFLERCISPFTRDDRCSIESLRDTLPFCWTRIDVVRWGLLDQFIDYDPPVARNEIVETEAIKILAGIIPAAENGDGTIVLGLVKAHSSHDLRVFVEHLPFRIIHAVITALANLPSSQAPLALGLFYLKLGLYERARAAIENVKWTDSHSEAEAVALRVRIDMKQYPGPRSYEQGIRLLTDARKINSGCLESILGLANACIERGWYPRAFGVLNGLDDLPAANYYRGKAYERDGDIEEAVRFYQRAVFGPWYTANNAEAFEFGLSNATWHGYKRKALSQLARIYAVKGEHELALTLYNRIFEEHPYDGESLRHYVPYLFQLGQYDQAIKRILTLASVSPLTPWCFEMLSDLYKRHGREDLALPMWLGAQFLTEAMLKRRSAA